MISVNRYEIAPQRFPDGTFNLTHLESFFAKFEDGKAPNSFYNIEWRYQGESEAMLLWFVAQHLKDKCKGAYLVLHMPYIPNARMDRTKHQFTEVFTLKYFADFINSIGFNEVHVLDPHSNVSEALFNKVVIHTPTNIVKKILNNPTNDITMLYFPDEGASKRYKDEFKAWPYLYGEKNRDWETGKIKGITVRNPMCLPKDKIRGAHVLIVDDICSKGGTFYHGANALKELGVGQVDLYVTHCEMTIQKGELLKSESPITKIYTTNSLLDTWPSEKVTIMSYEEAM